MVEEGCNWQKPNRSANTLRHSTELHHLREQRIAAYAPAT